MATKVAYIAESIAAKSVAAKETEETLQDKFHRLLVNEADEKILEILLEEAIAAFHGVCGKAGVRATVANTDNEIEICFNHGHICKSSEEESLKTASLKTVAACWLRCRMTREWFRLRCESPLSDEYLELVRMEEENAVATLTSLKPGRIASPRRISPI